MHPILSFDMETVPDADSLRALQGDKAADLADADMVEIAQRLKRQKANSDFMPLHLHRIIAISFVLRVDDDFKISTLPLEGGGERDAVEMFFKILAKYKPTLVSWNGGGFDLPVLHYRAMKHNIAAPAYWEIDARRQTYTNRFHERHIDLMDMLGLYQMQTRAPLDEFAKVCGMPGKMGIAGGGAGVWEAYKNGGIDAIRRYCEVDAMLTYLLYVRFQHFRGRINADTENFAVRDFLRNSGDDHWHEFLRGWPEQKTED